MKICLVAAAFVSGLAFGSARPDALHRWDFEEVDGGGFPVDTGRAAGRFAFRSTNVCAGVGANGSAGCRIGRNAGMTCPCATLACDEFTLDMRFRLDGPVSQTEGNTLWYYAWCSWKRGRAMLGITKDSRYYVSFYRPKDEKAQAEAVDFHVESERQRIEEGVFHAVRLTFEKAGVLKVYADGESVIEKGGCPGFRGIEYKPDCEWWPFLRFGQNDDLHDKPCAFLDGVIDDVAIYDTALGAPPIAVAGDRMDPNVLVLDASGTGRTGKFLVKDKVGTGQNGLALGATAKAEARFLDAAADVKMIVDGQSLSAVFDCPVPKGMKIVRNDSFMWGGDVVEMFVRPDPSRDVDFQYAVNAAGLNFAAKYENGNAVSGFKSAFATSIRETETGFKVAVRIPLDEVFATPPRSGDVFRAQFCRSGETCGGVSSWRPVGGAFRDPATYGWVVFENPATYYKNLLGKERENLNRTISPGKEKSAAEGELAALSSVVAQHGADPAAVGLLQKAFKNYGQKMLSLANAGRALMISAPGDPWQNRLEPDALTQPLKRINIKAVRNARFWYPMAVSNLTDDRPYLGRVKMFDHPLKDSMFQSQEWDGVAKAFRLHETYPVYTRAESKVYDPVVPLQMGSILRIAPHETSLLWLELDTHGVAAGKYSTSLVIKRETPGFQTETIAVDVEVVDADMDTVSVDRAGFNYMGNGMPRPEFAKFLVDRGYNVVYADMNCGMGKTYTKVREGDVLPGDMSYLDRVIGIYEAAGLKRARMALWLFLVLEEGGGPIGAGRQLSEPWNRAMKAWLEQLYAHLSEKYGLGADRVTLLVVDEPHGDVNDPATKMGHAYRLGKALRSFGPQYRLMTDPLSGVPEAQWRDSVRKLSEVYDVLMPYRPGLSDSRIDLVKSLPFKEIATYSILSKEGPALDYRLDYWSNLRDGFAGFVTYWHLDACTGDSFDATDSVDGKDFTDYGSIYVDYNLGTAVPTRRQIAADLGYEDQRLVAWCRRNMKDAPELLQAVEAAVKHAADKGGMADMDAARLAIVDLVKRLVSQKQ